MRIRTSLTHSQQNDPESHVAAPPVTSMSTDNPLAAHASSEGVDTALGSSRTDASNPGEPQVGQDAAGPTVVQTGQSSISLSAPTSVHNQVQNSVVVNATTTGSGTEEADVADAASDSVRDSVLVPPPTADNDHSDRPGTQGEQTLSHTSVVDVSTPPSSSNSGDMS